MKSRVRTADRLLGGLKLEVKVERWKLKEPFGISGEVITDADLVVASLSDGRHVGRGECSPMRRFGHSAAAITAQLEALQSEVANGLDRATLQSRLPRGPARNALDCAYWDLEAKRSGSSVWDLVGLERQESLATARTVGLDSPERMAQQARALNWPLLKLKLGGPGDLERVIAVGEAMPEARLIVDVNEGWTMAELEKMVEPLERLGVRAIEQPLKATADDALRGFRSPMHLVADESCQDVSSLVNVVGKYQMVNIKLDKTGGLTGALRLLKEARRWNLRLMVGCMAGTSLAMAPAHVVGSQCEIVDLDAPTMLDHDRQSPMHYARGRVTAFSPRLWG